MAIPITCPGCKAAFEVPETLAGKTIRCTSCKTQLTVDSPAPAAADAKKPFGWAGKASPAAAAAKPAPEPLPLDDDDPAPAKTRPTSNGKAPARAAAAADEDDKGTPAKKPAVAKAAARRRDDDDDDDDYTPAKKKRKNQSGGSGAMVALIGGGLVALAAIVGLSIYLLSGDDKPDTASNSGSGAPPAAPVGMPGPGGPGGGRPMPGGDAQGEGSPVNAGGWQTFTTGGFSAEFPGTPAEDDGSFLGGGRAGALPPDVNLKAYVLKNGADSGYFVVRMDLPAQVAGVDPKQLLGEFARGAEKGMSGFGGRSKVGIGGNIDITQDGFPGKELQMTDKSGGNGGGVMRVILAGTKLYMYGSASDNFSAMQADTDRFIKSVKISGGSGGGVAIGGPNDPTRPGGGFGGPPGYPGRPGVPGGSGQGPPGGVPTPPTPGGVGYPMPGGP